MKVTNSEMKKTLEKKGIKNVSVLGNFEDWDIVCVDGSGIFDFMVLEAALFSDKRPIVLASEGATEPFDNYSLSDEGLKFVEENEEKLKEIVKGISEGVNEYYESNECHLDTDPVSDTYSGLELECVFKVPSNFRLLDFIKEIGEGAKFRIVFLFSFVSGDEECSSDAKGYISLAELKEQVEKSTTNRAIRQKLEEIIRVLNRKNGDSIADLVDEIGEKIGDEYVIFLKLVKNGGNKEVVLLMAEDDKEKKRQKETNKIISHKQNHFGPSKTILCMIIIL